MPSSQFVSREFSPQSPGFRHLGRMLRQQEHVTVGNSIFFCHVWEAEREDVCTFQCAVIFPFLQASGLWDSAAHTEGSWSPSRECSGKAFQRYPQACFPNPGAFKTVNEITMLTVKRVFEGGGRRIINLSVT